MIRPLLLFLVLGIASFARAETVDLGVNGTFKMEVPAGWKLDVARPNASNIDLTVSGPEGTVEQGKITLILAPQPMFQTGKDPVEAMLTSMSAQALPSCVEKKVTPVSFGLIGGYGAYSIFTDAKLVGQPPKAGDWKVMAAGVLGLSADVMGTASLFTDDPKSPAFAALLKMVSTAVVTKKQ